MISFLRTFEDKSLIFTVYHDFSFSLVRVAHARVEPGVGDFAVFNGELPFPAFLLNLHPSAEIIDKKKTFLKSKTATQIIN